MEQDPVVSLLGKSLVVPAARTKIRQFFLSCLDIFWQDIHCNRKVIFYKPIGRDSSSAIDILKKSLSVVLVHYYPWAGRLVFGDDRRLLIDCNDLGVEFVEASIDLPIGELEKDDFQMKVFFDNLCQKLEQENVKLCENPLLSVQVTQFSDGGLAIAIAQSHVVADGQSLWHFMVSWGECARGEKLSLEPLHDRTMLALPLPSPERAVLKFYVDEDGAAEKSEKPVANTTQNELTTEKLTASLPENGKMAVSETETPTESGLANDTATAQPTEKVMSIENGEKSGTGKPMEHNGDSQTEPEALVQHTYHMSGAAIKKLKSEAEQETGNRYSSYQILGAHFWQRVTIARQRPATEPAIFSILSNNRSRLRPPLPPSYFGNVIGFAMIKSYVGTIAGESIGSIADRIHAGVAASTEERLREMMHWLELHDNRMMREIPFEGKFIHVASSPRFPVYEVDFGWGKPAAVRAVKVPGDGEMVLFGGRPGSSPGDVEICMPLPLQAMQNLLQDPLFLASSSAEKLANE